MRRFLLVPLAVVAILAAGCDDEIVNVDIGVDTMPDLRVQVWDRHLGGPYEGALVTVYLPNGQTDGSHTGPDGWTTQWLLVPRNASRIQASVSFRDFRGNPRTDYGWIPLHRGDNSHRFVISTYAP